jgi:hypothetical protein
MLAPSPISVSAQTSPTASPRVKTRSGRSKSTGNVDFNPKTGSLRKRFVPGLENQALPETEEERQIKRSVEILRVKELVLPTSPPNSSRPNLAPITIEPPSPDLRSLSPSIDPRTLKTQSAYNPVTTAGLWDSGVVDRPGLKTRPTSLVVVNGKKEKEKRRQEKSKSKEKTRYLEVDGEGSSKSQRFKSCFRGIFHREKN